MVLRWDVQVCMYYQIVLLQLGWLIFWTAVRNDVVKYALCLLIYAFLARFLLFIIYHDAWGVGLYRIVRVWCTVLTLLMIDWRVNFIVMNKMYDTNTTTWIAPVSVECTVILYIYSQICENYATPWRMNAKVATLSTENLLLYVLYSAISIFFLWNVKGQSFDRYAST